MRIGATARCTYCSRNGYDASVAALVTAIREAEQHPAAIEADRRCDLSADDHRATKLLVCELAGVDDGLAIELERTYGDFATYSAYPEVVEVVAALAADHVKIAIVSDFHVDLRPHLASLGLLDLISGFALSCEIGVAKPHPMMFQAALEMVGVAPERCLMVGDNPTPDTGASAMGIATLILPLQRAPRPPVAATRALAGRCGIRSPLISATTQWVDDSTPRTRRA